MPGGIGLRILVLVVARPQRKESGHSDTAVADVGAHPSAARSIAHTPDTILSIIDSFPVRHPGCVRTLNPNLPYLRRHL
jgi:hypothetical protein